jgi:hypothetical protein
MTGIFFTASQDDGVFTAASHDNRRAHDALSRRGSCCSNVSSMNSAGRIIASAICSFVSRA